MKIRSPGSDFWPAAILLAASLFFVVHIHWRESGTAQFGVSPRTVPLAMAVMIAALAAVLILTALLRARRSDAMNGMSTEHRAGIMLISGVVYVAAMSWIGYLVASALFVGWTALLFGARRPPVIIAMMTLAPLALQLFFEKFMLIPLPEWRLGG